MNFIVSTLWARITGLNTSEEFLVNSVSHAESEEEALGSAIKSVQKELSSKPAMLKQSMVTRLKIVDEEVWIDNPKPENKESSIDRQKKLGIN